MAGVNGVEIKVGQVWRQRDGTKVRIARREARGHWGSVRVSDGCEMADIYDDGRSTLADDVYGLAELVTDEQGRAPVTHADSAALAEETLVALGWTFNGQAWIEQTKIELIEGGTPAFVVPGYELLADVFHRAYNQAAVGKGKERHANGEPFDEQVMQDGARRFGVGALLFQAFKKSEESQRLPLDRGVNELLGAMVYLAGAVIRREADAAEGGV